jgi:excisionase family DNA binding protein
MAEVLTATQAAAYLQVSASTIRRLAREKRLPAARMGRRWRFQKSALDQWLADGGGDYEKIVDQGLLEATREAFAEEGDDIPFAQVQVRYGL